MAWPEASSMLAACTNEPVSYDPEGKYRNSGDDRTQLVVIAYETGLVTPGGPS
jgi:hypothetical protein